MREPQPSAFDALAILVGVTSWMTIGAVVLTVILFVVGEAVEHFTP